mgnify:CR=1 FL=1
MRNRILTGAVAIASVAAISFGTVSTASAAPAYKPYPHPVSYTHLTLPTKA